MATIEWQGRVRIVLGEITRAQQVTLWRDYQTFIQSRPDTDDTSAVDMVAWQFQTDQFVLAAAVKAVWVHRDGDWRRLPEGKSYDLEVEPGYHITLAMPLTAAHFDELPRRLVDDCVKANVEVNGDIQSIYNFFISSTPANGTTNSAPEPDSTPSDSTPSPTPTTTPGD